MLADCISPTITSSVDEHSRDDKVKQLLSKQNMNKVIQFVSSYGAYLQLHKSLLYAAEVQSEEIMQSILDMARYDVHHLDAIKTLDRRNSLILYEPAFLSALLIKLPMIKNDMNQMESMLPILVSAYPDLKPWQVRKVVYDCTGPFDSFEACKHMQTSDGFCYGLRYYYKYLCVLLDQDEGNDMARQNAELVKEWCMLSSSSQLGLDEMKKNFRKVASKKLGESDLYNRDLPFLIDISVSIDDRRLALQLGEEIIHDKICSNDVKVMSMTLNHIRTICKKSIQEGAQYDGQHIDMISLKKSIILLQSMITSSNKFTFPATQNLSNELIELLNDLSNKNICSNHTALDHNNSEHIVSHKEEALIRLISNVVESNVALETISKWKKLTLAPSTVLASLRKCLMNGSTYGNRNEISGALLHIKKMRAQDRPISRHSISFPSNTRPGALHPFLSRGSIWRKVLKGEAVIEK